MAMMMMMNIPKCREHGVEMVPCMWDIGEGKTHTTYYTCPICRKEGKKPIEVVAGPIVSPSGLKRCPFFREPCLKERCLAYVPRTKDIATGNWQSAYCYALNTSIDEKGVK